MYTSFSKRERQYDPCRAKEINNPGTRRYRKSVGENKQEQAKTRTSLVCMVSWTFPMGYKYSPFDKSNESIESTKVDGALLQQRYFSKSS